MIMKGSE